MILETIRLTGKALNGGIMNLENYVLDFRATTNLNKIMHSDNE